MGDCICNSLTVCAIEKFNTVVGCFVLNGFQVTFFFKFYLFYYFLWLFYFSERLPGDGASYDDLDEDDGLDGLDEEGSLAEDGKLVRPG